MNMPAQLSQPIHAKVAAGGIAGAASILVVWALGHFVTVPAEIAASITTLLTFGVGYLKTT